jgi:hypothetical protein
MAKYSRVRGYTKKDGTKVRAHIRKEESKKIKSHQSKLVKQYPKSYKNQSMSERKVIARAYFNAAKSYNNYQLNELYAIAKRRYPVAMKNTSRLHQSIRNSIARGDGWFNKIAANAAKMEKKIEGKK